MGPTVVLGALSLLALASCTRATTPPPSSPSPSGDPHYREVVTLTWEDLDRFWSGEFPLVSANAYRSPQHFYEYRGNSAPPVPCLITQWAGNAYYCSRDMSISWDQAWIQEGIRHFSRIEDMVPVAVLAHEWGHHIQFLAGAMFKSGAERELQADCYAGLFIDDASGGRGGLALEPSDVSEVLLTFFQVGDSGFQRSLWYEPGLHGGARERTLAFAAGYIAADPSFCLAYGGSGPPLDLNVGPYVMTLLPRTAPHPLGGGVTKLASSWFQDFSARVAWLADLPAEPAREQLPAIAEDWLKPLLFHWPVGDAESFDVSWIPGSAAVMRYGGVRVAGGEVQSLHGALFLHVRPGGGGLLLDVVANGPAPAEFPAWELLGDYRFTSVYGIEFR